MIRLVTDFSLSANHGSTHRTTARRLFFATSLCAFLAAGTLPTKVFASEQHLQLAASDFLGSKELEPRLRGKQLEEEKQERERKRRAIEQRKSKSETRKKDNSWRPVHKQEEVKTEEDKEYEEKKEYMSYFQRVKHSWSRANSLQDVFDQTLSKGYAPAQVKEPYLNLKSGPGRNYPVIYIAEQSEWVDFASIRTSWYEIQTKDGHAGWVNQRDLPATLSTDESNINFADAAKSINIRSNPVDIGFSSGIINDDAFLGLHLRNHNSPFYSTEVSYGKGIGEESELSYLYLGILSHPLTEWRMSPHLTLGMGRMKSEFIDVDGLSDSESNLFVKAGLGVTRSFDQRFRLRADLNQFAVNTENELISSFSQLSLGAAFVWGSVTDKVLNRTIGKKVGVSDFEISYFSGSISLDDSGTYSSKGLRGTYHVSEDYFFEINYADVSAVDLNSYAFNAGYNILPGEVVIPWGKGKSYWPTQIFVLGGTGNYSTDTGDDIAMIAGFGLKLNPLRKFAIRFDVRENFVRQRINNEYKFSKNPESSLGLSYYF